MLLFLLRRVDLVVRGRGAHGLAVRGLPSGAAILAGRAGARGADMNAVTRIGTRAALDDIAAALTTAAPHQMPLIHAVRAGLIALVTPNRDATSGFLRETKRLSRPTLLLIGDDDHAATGPPAGPAPAACPAGLGQQSCMALAAHPNTIAGPLPPPCGTGAS